MCKDTTKKSNDQTELFISDAFRVEKPVKLVLQLQNSLI